MFFKLIPLLTMAFSLSTFAAPAPKLECNGTAKSPKGYAISIVISAKNKSTSYAAKIDQSSLTGMYAPSTIKNLSAMVNSETAFYSGRDEKTDVEMDLQVNLRSGTNSLPPVYKGSVRLNGARAIAVSCMTSN